MSWEGFQQYTDIWWERTQGEGDEGNTIEDVKMRAENYPASGTPVETIVKLSLRGSR